MGISLTPYDVENLLELICCLHIFGEVSVKVFGPLSNCIVFVLLHFRSSLHILDHSSLSDVFLAIIFSPSMACLLILLKLPFCRADAF